MATLTLDTAQGSLLDAIEERPARGERAPEARRRSTPASPPAAPDPSRLAGPETAASAAPARTLDDLIAGAWSALSVTQTTTCPLCGGDVLPRFGAGPQPVAGACRSCGTELS